MRKCRSAVLGPLYGICAVGLAWRVSETLLVHNGDLDESEEILATDMAWRPCRRLDLSAVISCLSTLLSDHTAAASLWEGGGETLRRQLCWSRRGY
jgi:hypothetical protein